MESWELLDTDDSDIIILPQQPTLLPCKRSKPNSRFTTPFKPCSSQPSQSSHPKTQSQNPAPSSSIIPGPAGTIQAAMHRKAVINQNKDPHENNNATSTQEFLMRAVQEDGSNADNDGDFKMNSWLCAMEFIGQEKNNFLIASSLGSIKKCRKSVERLPLVVAIVKSCTPNGLGDLIATLKDTSGTIGANIHRKVLTESEFGKDIAVGATLILHKVAVFSPSPSAYYLNITLNNVLKVISQESGPPSSDTCVASQVRCVASQVRGVASITGMIRKPAFVRLGTAETTTDEDVSEYMKTKGSVGGETLPEEHIPLSGRFSITTNGSSHQRSVEEVKHLVRKGVTKEATIEQSKGDDNGKDQIMTDYDMQPEGIPSGIMDCSRNGTQHAFSAAKPTDNLLDDSEIDRTSGVTKERPQMISKTILPQWTDEQLDELFADGVDDW
ncbi:hypothetical protein IFM89_014935 [Coptis chinensis]|uniref:Homologous recombination OB-fold protein OB-fold domain-containing protein n=1 Tax=Coptis chinensis TaxID=261450 RepID=A0A835H305_9MAGN|nr:hypothetical protein IFM89_014935 [Coptis chinensis]